MTTGNFTAAKTLVSTDDHPTTGGRAGVVCSILFENCHPDDQQVVAGGGGLRNSQQSSEVMATENFLLATTPPPAPKS